MRIRTNVRLTNDLITVHLKDPNASRDNSSNVQNHDERFQSDYVITKLRHQIPMNYIRYS